MDQTVIWSFKSRKSLREVIDYLQETVSPAYADRYLDHVQRMARDVARQPTKGMYIDLPHHLRRWPIDRHNYIVYRIQANGIYVTDILSYHQNTKGF